MDKDNLITGFFVCLLALMGCGFIYSLFQPYTMSGIITGVDMMNQSGIGGSCYYTIVYHDSNKAYALCSQDISDIKPGLYCSITMTHVSSILDKIECKKVD
jgi:hypothetical protein